MSRRPQRSKRRAPKPLSFADWAALTITGIVAVLIVVALVVLFAASRAHARDQDGRYANSPLKAWFDSLASHKGPCCSFVDGVSVKDVDWDSRGGKYRVRLGGQWIDVPDDALVTEPNKFGAAVVWPYVEDGVTKIRCFIPGALT